MLILQCLVGGVSMVLKLLLWCLQMFLLLLSMVLRIVFVMVKMEPQKGGETLD